MKIKCMKCGKIEDEKKVIKQRLGWVDGFFCSERCSNAKSEEMKKYWKDTKNGMYWAVGGIIVFMIIFFLWVFSL